MRTSAFLYGVVVGVVGAIWVSRQRKGLMSMAGQTGAMMDFANLAKSKSNGSFDSHALADLNLGGKRDIPGTSAQSTPSNKEANMKMIKDFIKGNPEIRREVDQILKETHSVIPGL